MAKDLYTTNRFTSSFWFVFFIPIGMIIAFYLYDFGSKVYFQNMLDKDTKVIFTEMMDREGLDTNEEKKDFIESEFKEKKYELSDLNLIYQDDGSVIVVAYRKYMSIVGTLSGGLLRSKNRMVSSSYIGHYNEYKETVVEEYNEVIDEDLIAE